jgi:hypothetical protein
MMALEVFQSLLRASFPSSLYQLCQKTKGAVTIEGMATNFDVHMTEGLSVAAWGTS